MVAGRWAASITLSSLAATLPGLVSTLRPEGFHKRQAMVHAASAETRGSDGTSHVLADSGAGRGASGGVAVGALANMPLQHKVVGRSLARSQEHVHSRNTSGDIIGGIFQDRPLQHRVVVRSLAQTLDHVHRLHEHSVMPACQRDSAGEPVGCRHNCKCSWWESCFTKASSDEPFDDIGTCAPSTLLMVCVTTVYWAVLLFATITVRLALMHQVFRQAQIDTRAALKATMLHAGTALESTGRGSQASRSSRRDV